MGDNIMGDEIQVNDKPKVEMPAIRRGNVTITSTQRSPVIYTAMEQVAWTTGQAQINGIGITRNAALDALEESCGKLKKALAVAV